MKPKSVQMGVLVLLGALTLGGCSSVMRSATSGFTDGIAKAILNQDDPETIRSGAPTLLIVLDGMIENDPEDPATLIAAAELYGAYATAFVREPEQRARTLAARGLGYAERAVCRTDVRLCGIHEERQGKLEKRLANAEADQVPALFALASSWAGWIQANSDDFGAIADVPKVMAIMRTVERLDEGYRDGRVHLYLGVLNTLLPPAVGGKPEIARRHFDRAIELSEGKDLTALVLYAKHYARLVFDQDLHDRLLNRALATDHRVPGLVLTNVLAREEAKVLLESGKEYF